MIKLLLAFLISSQAFAVTSLTIVNSTGQTVNYRGQAITNNGTYAVPTASIFDYSTDPSLLSDLANLPGLTINDTITPYAGQGAVDYLRSLYKRNVVGDGSSTLNILGSTPIQLQLMARMSVPTNQYCAPVRIRQNAATASGGTVWAMRFSSSATRKFYLQSMHLTATFDAATPLGRSLQSYDIMGFSNATPTSGTAITVVSMDGGAASSVTDARFLDTGLTTTSVSFGTAFSTISVPAAEGAVSPYVRDSVGLALSAGQGLAIRLNGAAVVGQGLSGEVCWLEL